MSKGLFAGAPAGHSLSARCPRQRCDKHCPGDTPCVRSSNAISEQDAMKRLSSHILDLLRRPTDSRNNPGIFAMTSPSLDMDSDSFGPLGGKLLSVSPDLMGNQLGP
ncbi:hypothetical protein BV22DRAFT_97100 [Leucogyrophana mollusca]|uniref:Uncharacterized protein n=1 Tax=Leucogyrophana mollusca TaxID=85980 RepID=A0ACB8BVM0_9AGAM|nr:hypothetical protein BV22DRAFT_97100 [Leucogyrophana mollusca]